MKATMQSGPKVAIATARDGTAQWAWMNGMSKGNIYKIIILILSINNGTSLSFSRLIYLYDMLNKL